MMLKKIPTLRWSFKFTRDTNYYFGLTLLIIASLSIIWAVVRDAFDVRDFLAYFLVYMWGYVLLLKSDFELRVHRLEHALDEAEKRIEALYVICEPTEESEDTEEGEVEEEFIPGLSGVEEDSDSEKPDIYNEWEAY